MLSVFCALQFSPNKYSATLLSIEIVQCLGHMHQGCDYNTSIHVHKEQLSIGSLQQTQPPEQRKTAVQGKLTIVLKACIMPW